MVKMSGDGPDQEEWGVGKLAIGEWRRRFGPLFEIKTVVIRKKDAESQDDPLSNNRGGVRGIGKSLVII